MKYLVFKVLQGGIKFQLCSFRSEEQKKKKTINKQWIELSEFKTGQKLWSETNYQMEL